MQNLPIKLYKAAQVRELDRIAIHDFGIPGFELMSRAGAKAFQLLRQSWPQTSSITVFCGAGNNAGDGYVLASLALGQGLNVQVCSVVDPEILAGDAKTAYQHYCQANGKVDLYLPGQAVSAEVVVDALLGTGLDRPVSGLYADVIASINDSQAWVLAVDIPSGLNADTGNVMGCAVNADKTISFIALKQGLFTGQAADYCGEVVYGPLDVPEAVYSQLSTNTVRVVDTPMPKRQRNSHKGCFGHVLVVGGDYGYSGAVRLAGEAALRVGAGLVGIATRPGHSAVLNLNRPELMCHGIGHAGQLQGLLAKVDVVVIGPGLGQSAWAKSLFDLVMQTDKPIVVDADGLNLLAKAGLQKQSWVLTPHPGEAGRLLACPTAAVQQDRFQAAAALQSQYGGVAVLKGAGTIIASAQQMAVSNTGNPGMASGGMGDVLAGVIAGLIAQGLTLPQAAGQGVYIHGLAADLAAAQAGERGLLASDLMVYLRQLVN